MGKKIEKLLFILGVILAITAGVIYLFNISFAGKVMSNFHYHYLIIGLILPFAFIRLPFKYGSRKFARVLDITLAVLSFIIPMYLFTKSQEMVFLGWNTPSTFNFWVGLILVLMSIEAGRRAGGFVYMIVAVVLGLYPLYGKWMPGMFYGSTFPFVSVIGSFAYGGENGIPGLPSRIFADIIMGYLVFAGILLGSGAGDFFLKIAFALLGRYRGGPAKVSVFSSCLFGSVSGSAVSNVVGTGTVTIPTMKRIGYPAAYAGAVEAVASTGGILMPPVMGTVAFIMAEMTQTPYSKIIIAAAMPALLYYWGLLLQVDFYAAKTGLKGLSREKIPSLKQTFKDGWHFIFAFLILIFALVYLRLETIAPYYASASLIVLSMFRKETRMGYRKIVSSLEEIGKLMAFTLAVILPMAPIVAGLTLTGVAPSFTSAAITLGHGNVVAVILLGTVAAYIMGMVGMGSIAYIFLAATYAPGLIHLGLNFMSVHLFLIYVTMLACITPPVAAAAFVAAGLAQANPMRVALTACRLGIVIYFIPYFFLINPALVAQGGGWEPLISFIAAAAGVALIAAGLEGYLPGIGKLDGTWLVSRPFLFIAGFILAYPQLMTDVIGVVMAAIIIGLLVISKRARAKQALDTPS